MVQDRAIFTMAD